MSLDVLLWWQSSQTIIVLSLWDDGLHVTKWKQSPVTTISSLMLCGLRNASSFQMGYTVQSDGKEWQSHFTAFCPNANLEPEVSKSSVYKGQAK